jgi:hypothetical protein
MQSVDDQGTQHRVCDHRETSELNPHTIIPHWAFCPLGWHAPAINTWADHPLGVWIARCRHQLSGSTPLYDLPHGQPGARCAKWNQMSKSSAQSNGDQP